MNKNYNTNHFTFNDLYIILNRYKWSILFITTLFTEAFRSLRTNLQFMDKNKDATIILIISILANEWKTTASALECLYNLE